MSPDELSQLETIIEQFADCGETDAPYEVLMDFARRGYLECTRFESTPKALAALEAAKEFKP